MSIRTAEVVGGGLAGLSAATALAQRGWSVRPHEREDDVRALGAGIYVWGNGLWTLQSLGLYEEASEGAHVGICLESRDHRNRTIERIPTNGPGDSRVLTIMRDHLIGTLVRGARDAGVEIATGSQVLEATPEGTITTSSGESARADVVLAADGVNSRLRPAELVKHRPQVGQGAIRLTVPRSEDFVPSEDQDKYLEYFSGRKRVLYTPSSADWLYVALVADSNDATAKHIPIDVKTWVKAFPALRNRECGSGIFRHGESLLR